MLRRCLGELGADTTNGTLPDDLVVVQVGDLVHKGPDSPGVLALVDRMMAGSVDRWIQLIGNHEGQEGLGGPDFWPETLSPALRADVRRWVDTDRARLAVALDTVEYGPTLVTHAGLTRQKWLAIGRPEAPGQAAAMLNKELAADPELAFAAGEMLGVKPGSRSAWPGPRRASCSGRGTWSDCPSARSTATPAPDGGPATRGNRACPAGRRCGPRPTRDGATATSPGPGASTSSASTPTTAPTPRPSPSPRSW
jgi:hypothetical protein